MELEDKAKVVLSGWGAEIVQFLAMLTVLPRSVWKNRMNLTVSSKWTKGKTASAARNLTNFGPQTDATTFALSSNSIRLLILSFFYGRYLLLPF